MLAQVKVDIKESSKKSMTETTNQRIVALLPMKAHSARVSGKNFRDFCGKPLYRWILDTLLLVEEIDLIVINTDARDILAQNGLVESDKVLIRDRPEDICGDFVSMNKIIANDVENVPADIYLMTHTTNPLLSMETIHRAINAYKLSQDQASHDSLFTVDRIRTRFYERDGTPVNHDPNILMRTQDLNPWYRKTRIYISFLPPVSLRQKHGLEKSLQLFISPKYESIDIDEPEDRTLL